MAQFCVYVTLLLMSSCMAYATYFKTPIKEVYRCDPSNYRADGTTPGGYLQKVDGLGFVHRQCPYGLQINPQHCRCEYATGAAVFHKKAAVVIPKATGFYHAPSSYVKKEVYRCDPSNYRADGTKPGAYLQRVDGLGYVHRQCPYGLVMVSQHCRCEYATGAAGFHKKAAVAIPKATGVYHAPRSYVKKEVYRCDPSNYRADGTKPGAYLQRVDGLGYVHRQCPYGLVMVSQHCRCEYATAAQDFHKKLPVVPHRTGGYAAKIPVVKKAYSPYGTLGAVY